MRDEDGVTIRLEDYRPADFRIHHVDMTVRLFEGHADIDTTLELERRPGAPAGVAIN